jgi:hypothetical protein
MASSRVPSFSFELGRDRLPREGYVGMQIPFSHCVCHAVELSQTIEGVKPVQSILMALHMLERDVQGQKKIGMAIN